MYQETWIILVEVLPDGNGGWKVEAHWNGIGDKALVHRSRWQRSAETWARGFCTAVGSRPETYGPCELNIKNRKGRIRAKDSFGTDPWQIKG